MGSDNSKDYIIEYRNKCPFCQENFQKEELFHYHIVDEVKIFKCPFCNEKIKDVQTFKNHIRKEALKEEEKEETTEYEKIEEINKFNNVIEERNFLMKFKNQRLINQLSNIKKNMKELENIDKAENLIQIEEEITKKEIKRNCSFFCCGYNKYLGFNFKVIGLLFVIFNLVGIYQLISLLNATEEELLFGIKSILFEKNRTNYTEIIVENYENYNVKNIPNFDIELFFLTSIIGKLFLKRFGFRLSSIIFILINSIAIFLLSSFKFPENRYTFYQFLLLLLYYILFYISVGCISLFPHQIYFEGLRKFYIYIDERNKENNYSFFSYLCFTIIPAYLIHFILNIYFDYQNYYNNIFIIIIIVYAILTLFSTLLLYSIYSCVFTYHSTIKSNSERSIWKIFGYLIYCEKNIHKNKIICCRSCRITFRNCYYKIYENPLEMFCPCFLSSCCICNGNICCKYVKLSELYQENEQLCYCYKVQTKLSWFTDLLFKNDIFTLICINIYLEIMIIGFQKKINESLHSNIGQKI